jgi:hypothetical protein
VVGGDQQEQRLTLDLALDPSQGRAVAVRPPLGIYHLHPAAPQPADDGRNQSGVVAHHHQDPLQPSGEQGPNGPLGQAQPAQPEQDLPSSRP